MAESLEQGQISGGQSTLSLSGSALAYLTVFKV